MVNICVRYVQEMSNKFPRHVPDITQIFPRYVSELDGMSIIKGQGPSVSDTQSTNYAKIVPLQMIPINQSMEVWHVLGGSKKQKTDCTIPTFVQSENTKCS